MYTFCSTGASPSRSVVLSALAAGALVALWGCGGNAPYSPIVAGPNADMTLTTTTPSRTVTQGQDAVFALSVQAVGSFTSSVSLSITSGLTSGSRPVLSPSVLTPSVNGSAVSLTIPTCVLEPLDYPITVQATGGGITRAPSR